MKPVLSVVVPIYNGEKKLDRCIQSILNQTFDNFELILIDDGSIDHTALICDNYALNDKRIIVKHIQNSGVSSARNLGIDIANGKYLMFVDADDYVEKDMFMDYIQTIEQSNFDVVIGKLTMLFEDKQIISTIQINGKYHDDIWHNICLDSKPFGYVAGKLYNLDLIKKHCIRFNIYMKSQEDLDFALSVFKYCKSFYIIQNSGYYYDYSISNRKVPYKDLINNQLKIFQIAKEKIQLSQDDIKSISYRINELVYGYLYSATSYLELKNNMLSLYDKHLFEFCNHPLYSKKFFNKLVFFKQYLIVYLYFIIRKNLGRIKRIVINE